MDDNNYASVTGYPGLVRDLDTGAVLNLDTSKLERYRALKMAQKKKLEEKQTVDDRLDRLESTMSDIKDLLESLTKTYK